MIAVGQLPASVDWDSSSTAVERAATRLCDPEIASTLGSSTEVRDSSAYTWFWFVPTSGQRAHGARWISCHVGLLGGSRLLTLPTDETPAITTTPLTDDVARCLTARSFDNTACARRHAYRASGTFTMTQDTYPGARVIDRAAARTCPSRVSGSRYRWTYKLKTTWNLGDHVVVCYSRTSS